MAGTKARAIARREPRHLPCLEFITAPAYRTSAPIIRAWTYAADELMRINARVQSTVVSEQLLLCCLLAVFCRSFSPGCLEADFEASPPL
jgi:hypothetical protein